MSNEEKIERLETVLGTLILWLYKELGSAAVDELHHMLTAETQTTTGGGE